MSQLFRFFVFLSGFCYIFASPEVCSNSLIPGEKGDQGEGGECGEEGKLGKNGQPGLPGVPGDPGLKGDVGPIGKMGPIGEKGDKGPKGLDGPLGLKGKAGTTCDCGRYRKVVRQLEENLGKLRNTVKFLKNVVLGLKETEEKYYLLVKEPKKFKEASMNCKLRGGTLAMPKTNNINRLMTDYISQAGLTRVYVGVQAQSIDTDEAGSFIYADATPLREFAAWSKEDQLYPRLFPTTNSSCVELLSTGTWNNVECDAPLFFVCEFPKSRRRVRGGLSSSTA